MSGGPAFARVWAAGLWLVLMAGILVAWSPRYWAVSVAAGGVCLLAVLWLILARDIDLPRQTPLVACIAAFGFLQIGIHTTVLPQLTLDNALLWAVGALAFLLGSQILRDRGARRLFLGLTMWSLTVLAVAAMLQFYGTPDKVFGIFPAVPGTMGTFLSANQFAALMEIAAPIALWSMLGRNPIPGGLCYAMILAATFAAASRTGFILVCGELGVFVVVALTARRRETKALTPMFVGLIALVIAASVIAGTERIRTRFDDKNPYAVRKELLDSTLKLIAERPFTGYGMGTWRAVYPSKATFDMALLANEAHNDWAQWTCDGGVPFLVLMLGLVVWLVKPALGSIWGMGVVSVMLHSYVDYPTREPVLLFFWFAMAGGVSRLNGQRPERKSDKSHGFSEKVNHDTMAPMRGRED